MKAKMTAVIGMGLLALASTALAGPWGWRSSSAMQGTPVNIESVKKFQEETTALRNEMMIKKMELRNEYLKDSADTAKVAALTKEIGDLQTKITAIATSNGLPGPGGGCGMGCGMGGMGMGRGMMRTAYQNR